MFLLNKKKKHYSALDLSRAKQLYFLNFANYGNMQRNGEYEEYVKYSIPKTLEQEWSRIILNDLVEKIKNGENVWLVSNLANVRIDEMEIIKSFKILSKSSNAFEIRIAFEKSEILIPPELFEKIKKVLYT